MRPWSTRTAAFPMALCTKTAQTVESPRPTLLPLRGRLFSPGCPGLVSTKRSMVQSGLANDPNRKLAMALPSGVGDFRWNWTPYSLLSGSAAATLSFGRPGDGKTSGYLVHRHRDSSNSGLIGKTSKMPSLAATRRTAAVFPVPPALPATTLRPDFHRLHAVTVPNTDSELKMAGSGSTTPSS